jgi:ubiquinone/menaquinone biosynthesis C-methylase UbiE
MADVESNLEVWNRWDWSRAGEEWSDWWGDTDALWHGALLPRIHAFLPSASILEIAPGYGRWTQYLKDACERLVIVDLTESCIEYCRQRFADSSHIEYHVNDGSSLAMVEDDSVDFAFSFDSLVHVEAPVLEAYIEQLARKLTPQGVAFIHHSTVGDYGALNGLVKRIPERLRRPLAGRGAVIDVYAWRATSVTADAVAEHCQRVGLACVSQEKINWENGGPYLLDAISVITPRGSRWERPRRVWRNRSFRREGERMAQHYARRSFPSATG